jgi:hypothetical protein
MAKVDRIERMDVRRAELEAHYTEAFITALQMTAAGVWGLFDHKPDRWARAKIAPIIENLSEMSQTIDGIRTQLGMEPFGLHREFLASRGPVASNAVGEPKQARAWLEKLGVPVPGNGR